MVRSHGTWIRIQSLFIENTKGEKIQGQDSFFDCEKACN